MVSATPRNIFISYSRIDETFARQLATQLERDGAEIWIDVDDIPPGANWSTSIQEGLRQCQTMILIFSPNALASHNVEAEWQDFYDNGKTIIPIVWRPVRDPDVHFQIRRLQRIDFYSQHFDTAYHQLVSVLGQAGMVLHQPLSTATSISHAATLGVQRIISPLLGLVVVAFGILVTMVIISANTQQQANSTSPTGIPQVTVTSALTETAFVYLTEVYATLDTAIARTYTPSRAPTDVVVSTQECVHIVQPGDWFYSIAREYGVDPAELLAANPRVNPDTLQTGDILIIPHCSTGTPNSVTSTNVPTSSWSGRTYIVVAGDTLGSIARKFGVAVQAIKALNGLSDDFLDVGQVLQIPAP